MVLFIFFLLVLLRLVLGGNPDALAWIRLGLPLLSHLASPIQHLKAAILDAWSDKVLGRSLRPERFSVWAFAGCPWLLAAP